MIDPEHINTDRSISSGWLKGRFPMIDLIQWYAAIVIVSLFICLVVYYVIQAWTLDLKTFAYAGVAGLVFGAYWLYRTFTVYKLHKVDTMMLAKDIRPLLIEHFTRQNLEIDFESDDKLVFLDPGPPAFLYGKRSEYIIVLYKNCTLHFCILGGEHVHFPRLFPPWFLRGQLAALVN